MAARVWSSGSAAKAARGLVTDGTADRTTGPSPEEVVRVLSLERSDPAWVDAPPFRAHLRHLMSVGSLSATEVAVVLGLSTRAVTALLEGRAGRPARRISPRTARLLLLVSATEVRGLRWCLTPAAAARLALARLLASGWSAADVAAATGFEVPDLDGLATTTRCNRLLAVRLLGLARGLPHTLDDEDLAPVRSAA